jgi:serine phosphatase RsbU (regulator of sigma subunit)
MNRWNVIVVACEGCEAPATVVRQRLIDHWPIDRAVSLTTSVVEALSLDLLAGADAVVLVADCSTDLGVLVRALALLEEASLAVLAVLDELPRAGNAFDVAGAMVETRSTPPQIIVAKLLGLLHRQDEIRRLRQEVTLANRFQGGLRGQIERIHEELQLAALVQRDFLPRELPCLMGVQFSVLWRPANYVSGDIYELVVLDEDQIGVFIADAVGHGVPAALMTMVICRSLVLTQAGPAGPIVLPPSEVLARLNASLIQRHGRTTRFATAAYAVVNCRQRTVSLAGAGHPPPLVVRADGQSRSIETAGGLLGVFPDESYPQVEFELAMDDRLLFYSDGFEQAFPVGKSDAYSTRLPTRQYLSEFDQLGELASAQQMVDALALRLDSQRGSLHQADDLTLIAVHAGPLVEAPAPPAAPVVLSSRVA